MKKFKRWFRKNKSNMLFSIGITLMIKCVADMSRFYSAFGGEDLLLVGVIGYWVYRWFEDKNHIKEKAPSH